MKSSEKYTNIEKDWKELLQHDNHIPEPTYQLQEGDRVRLGNLKDVYVVKSYQNGKYYEIDFSFIDNNYGNPITHTHQRRIVAWMDIRPDKEDDTSSLIEGHPIRLSFFKSSIRGLLVKAYKLGVDMTPEYQRDYVWDDKDRECLIDSIFHSL